jgi:hypothetical protein
MAAHCCATGDAVGRLAWRSVLFAWRAAFRSSIAANLADLSEWLAVLLTCATAVKRHWKPVSACDRLRGVFVSSDARQRESAQMVGGMSDAQFLVTDPSLGTPSFVSVWSRNRIHTLHRSHACPVRFESASFRFTEVEKSLLLLFGTGCGGLVDTPCSMRWILWMS